MLLTKQVSQGMSTQATIYGLQLLYLFTLSNTKRLITVCIQETRSQVQPIQCGLRGHEVHELILIKMLH